VLPHFTLPGRDILRSLHLDRRTGLITFTTRSPPKVLRQYNSCSRCGHDGTEELWNLGKQQDVCPLRHSVWLG